MIRAKEASRTSKLADREWKVVKKREATGSHIRRLENVPKDARRMKHEAEGKAKTIQGPPRGICVWNQAANRAEPSKESSIYD